MCRRFPPPRAFADSKNGWERIRQLLTVGNIRPRNPNKLVDISIDKGKIITIPIAKKEYSLEELLKGVSENNLHSEFDTGEPAGKEIW